MGSFDRQSGLALWSAGKGQTSEGVNACAIAIVDARSRFAI